MVKRKYETEDIISYNKWSFDNTKRKNRGKLTLRRVARMLYKKMAFKSTIYKIAGKYEKKFDN